MNTEEMEIFVSSIEKLNERLNAVEDSLNTESAQELARARRQAARERRLLQDEVRSSEGISARAAEDLVRSRGELETVVNEFYAKTAEVMAELDRKEKSTRTGQLFGQSQLNDLQQQVVDGQLSINEAAQSATRLHNDVKLARQEVDIIRTEVKNAGSNITKAAEEAAQRAVANMSDQAIKDEVARQVRLMLDRDE